MENFKQLGISKNLIKGLNELNIKTPTEVQKQVIPLLLHQDTDIVVQAPTGTGKTATFGLPILERINPKIKTPQALILCPTRELGQQIAKQLFKFTKYTDKVFTESVYGGEKIDRQISALQRPTHILVATPGRLIDLVQRKAVSLDSVQTIVLDEADEMLSMGFKKELDKILGFLSNVQNKWLFSATMPFGIQEIIKKHISRTAEKIHLSKKNIVNKNIKHQYIVSSPETKKTDLMQILKAIGKEQGIIFCKTKAATKDLTEFLMSQKISANGIHGDLLQKERDKVMRSFKNKGTQLLIATDIAARGLDVSDLDFVIHYELPDKDEYYTHRSGRTARAGRTGVSLALVTTSEIKQLRNFEKRLHIIFEQL
ncbi:DEAD/DEAH box helicase [Aureivirga sp. CE67]|uniref:DEAD/DEAH box helicase n=1 Tax=Aureivirga sp. CE67 TaxID=1788983 RepID=UPI0018C9AF1C|nr:DEAD/DEAH box helicase [Aureivirga sp. CE67]